jgi:hypothetical protein
VVLGKHTIIRILPRNFSNRVSNLIPDTIDRFRAQGLKKLLSDSVGLLLRQGQEEFHVVAVWQLSRLGGDATEEDGSKGTRLQDVRNRSVCGKHFPSHSAVGILPWHH